MFHLSEISPFYRSVLFQVCAMGAAYTVSSTAHAEIRFRRISTNINFNYINIRAWYRCCADSMLVRRLLLYEKGNVNTTNSTYLPEWSGNS
jgi:hypothetical protein